MNGSSAARAIVTIAKTQSESLAKISHALELYYEGQITAERVAEVARQSVMKAAGTPGRAQRPSRPVRG